MPLYPFKCSACGLEFDVSRAEDERERPADCPLDGAPAHLEERASPLRRADGSERERRQGVSWSAFMHDHGPGTLPHPHGAGTPFHRR